MKEEGKGTGTEDNFGIYKNEHQKIKVENSSGDETVLRTQHLEFHYL